MHLHLLERLPSQRKQYKRLHAVQLVKRTRIRSQPIRTHPTPLPSTQQTQTSNQPEMQHAQHKRQLILADRLLPGPVHLNTSHFTPPEQKCNQTVASVSSSHSCCTSAWVSLFSRHSCFSSGPFRVHSDDDCTAIDISDAKPTTQNMSLGRFPSRSLIKRVRLSR